MRVRGPILVSLMGILGGLIAVAPALFMLPATATATPGFARQTGLSCQGCHTVFPELTPFGRKFKMNAYVFTNVKETQDITVRREKTLTLSDLPPFSVQLQGSFTALANTIPDTAGSDFSQRDELQFPQALSLFYTGKIAPTLGAFLQLTWNPSPNAVGIDNSELRFADHAGFGSGLWSDFIYGVTFNNNPTSQDVWNSTPAWGYPFIVTNVGVPPVTKVLLDGQLAQESAGLGAYLYLFDHLYLELDGYRSAQTHFTNATTGGPGPLDSTAPNARISSFAAPYWRAAWEQSWGNHSLEVGTFGIWAKTHPPGVGESGPTNDLLDIALDAEYQFIGDDHIFSAMATWIHEDKKINNVTLAEHPNHVLDTVRLTANYFFRRKIGGSFQWFSTTGSADPILYASGTNILGSFNGKPTTQGYIAEIDYMLFLNTKLGVQYTGYTKFNGKVHNYDGALRNAGDNNALFVFIWTAF